MTRNGLSVEAALNADEYQAIDVELAGRLAETFKTLGDPTRVRIIAVLARGERCVADLARTLNMSPSAVSHQLRLLRHMWLVRQRKVGRQVYYALDDAHIGQLFQCGLEHVRHSG